MGKLERGKYTATKWGKKKKISLFADIRDYFFPLFLSLTPLASLPRFPRLDFCLCNGVDGVVVCLYGMLAALAGRNDCFGTSGKAFSLLLSLVTLIAGVPSSTRSCD